MLKKNILIIDDEKEFRELIEDILSEENMNVFTASNEKQGLFCLDNYSIDLVLLDLNLGIESGIDILKKIRKSELDLPVLILSAKTKTYNKVLGFGTGADDYITKPFDEDELIARINAHLRRYGKSQKSSKFSNECIVFDNLKFDLKKFQVYKNDKEIQLSSRCIKILHNFMENPGRVFSKEQIYDSAWDDTYFDENTIMVHICELRKKLEDTSAKPKYIKTIRGIGYKFIG